ncbi:hypothetical protein D9757_008447 [Collybiopsis confluens]|uniref:Cytochrome P450 n=1 Tax=Collybiopsis confluens TaxID=2823264 RepID=A0A8H5M668_9AGAR|nr:hypothetical protein D9757_008447 [Collybiopsis confluens]
MTFSTLAALGAIFLVTILVRKYLRWRSRMVKLNAIPAVGNSGTFSSYISARRFKDHAVEIIQEGYEKYPGQAFRVPLPDGWQVIVSGEEMIEDVKKASDSDLSFMEAVTETLQTDYTMGLAARIDPYQVDVVRTPLTRNLAAKFDDLRDEIQAAFIDEIPAKESEWTNVPMLFTVMKIVSRTSNRFFVGLPLCRDPDYVVWTYLFSCSIWLIRVDLVVLKRLNIEFTTDAFNGARVLGHYPGFLKPLVRRFLTNVPACLARATKHLAPVIRERLEKEEEYGTTDWPDKPNDLISWLLDEANTPERRKNIVHEVVSRVLLVNMAAIHTTSITFTNSLYQLAANPAVAQPLREEIQACVDEQGWTKAALGQMRKLDSFIKESQRVVGVGAINSNRKAMRDFRFSNGTVIPAGTMVGTPSYSLHHDKNLYEDPDSMDAFRFSNMRAKKGEGLKHQMVAHDPTFALFGNGGKHMCPGRFFAVNELKALVGHVLLNYDIKFENDGGVPPTHWDGASSTPNRTAAVMFRKRRLE